MNWFGPLLIQFKFSRATRLSEEQFEQFIIDWKRHTNPQIRGLEIMLFFSMKEALIQEKPVTTDFVHPLETVKAQ
jgi:hypothetical protein